MPHPAICSSVGNGDATFQATQESTTALPLLDRRSYGVETALVTPTGTQNLLQIRDVFQGGRGKKTAELCQENFLVALDVGMEAWAKRWGWAFFVFFFGPLYKSDGWIAGHTHPNWPVCTFLVSLHHFLGHFPASLWTFPVWWVCVKQGSNRTPSLKKRFPVQHKKSPTIFIPSPKNGPLKNQLVMIFLRPLFIFSAAGGWSIYGSCGSCLGDAFLATCTWKV